MHQNEHTNRNRDDQSEGLSVPWIFAGSLLFVSTLAAPVAVVQMGQETQPPLQIASVDQNLKPVQETQAHVQVQPTNTETVSLRAELAKGDIVPGVGAGNVQIGDKVDDVVAHALEPATLHYSVADNALRQNHEFDLDDLRLIVKSDPDIGRIESLGIAAVDCRSVRDFQLRQDGLPSTGDGLSIGSHMSRVVTRMGTPQSEAVAELAPSAPSQNLKHSYPGLTLSYCPDDLVVGAISVEHLGAPIQEPSAVIAIEPPAQLRDHSGTPLVQVTPSVAPSDSQIVAQAPAGLSVPAAGSDLPVPGDIPRQGDVAEFALGATPQPLLALNGAGFSRTDAFSPGRATLPERAVSPGYASWQQPETPELGATSHPASLLASVAETDLDLSPRQRREIQIRLSLIGFNPRGADGIFGPRTREAILAMQKVAELPQTGYLDADAVAYLKTKSRGKYDRWVAKQIERRQQRAAVQQASVVRLPAARNAPQCARDQRGQIIENQSWSCDVTVLEESLSALFSGRS